ncbi:MAG: hypothetical protein ACJAV7_001494 [Flavobacteriales bacterium]|jgi:hypothetical protein
MLRSLFILMASFSLGFGASAQIDSSITAQPQEMEDDFYVPPVKLKPRVGVGLGTFFFMGEVGQDDKGYNIGTAGSAWRLSVTNELTSYLDVRVFSLFGNFEVNEYTTDRHLNFKTEIRSLGVDVEYNFSNFIPTRTKIQPYLSVGIESFEFLSKTDYYDSNGNHYNYWSDGSIRDLPENHKDADGASVLHRDYNYETDLRDLDLDGLGKYADRSWSIPIGIGAQMLLTERFKLRFGTELHMTFTDLVDNVSLAGDGNRLGDSKNDRFLFTSATLTYDLNITPKSTPKSQPLQFMNEDGEVQYVVIDEDGDKDGINDFIDQETNTPEGAAVDTNGVALDGDGDGVPDYLDSEPNSATGAWVNVDGETVADEDFHHKYLLWTDSIPWEDTRWTMDSVKVESDPSHWSNTYSVKVASNKNGLTQAEINLLLSYKDVKSWTQGDESVYLIGDYDNLTEAVQRQMDLEHHGIEGQVAQQDGASMVDVSNEAKAVRSEMEKTSVANASFEAGTSFRIQIGAYRYDLSEDIFTGIDDLVKLKGQDGLTRYSTGSYDNMNDAAQRKIDLLMQGFEGAFVTAYRDGDRITLEDAGMTVREGAQDLTHDEVNHSIDKDRISFTILLGTYADELPTETLDKYLELGNVNPIRKDDGSINYYFGAFTTEAEMEAAMSLAQSIGIETAQGQGKFDKKIITLYEAKSILSSGTD